MRQNKVQMITVSLMWRNRGSYHRAKVSDYKTMCLSVNALEQNTLFQKKHMSRLRTELATTKTTIVHSGILFLKKCKDLGESGGEKGGISQEEKGDEDESEKNVKCLFHTTCYMKYADFNPFLQRLVPKQNKTKGNIMPNTIM